MPGLSSSLRIAMGVVLAGIPAMPPPALAARPEVRVTSDAPLRFGAFVVFSSGWRRVSATGAVSGGGIFPAATGGVGPAQFTVAYDRGNEGNKRITVSLEVMLIGAEGGAADGMAGQLSAFDSDLPGVPVLAPGQTVRLVIPDCVSRVCSRTFRIGGRLDVQRTSGGGDLSFALPMAATVIAVE